MANRGSYPHPVIDAADDVSSNFDVINVQFDPSQQDIEVTYEVRTDDPDLLHLLDSGLASHSLRWRCSATISSGEMAPTEYKRLPTGFKLRAWLDQQLVRGKVDAEVRVIVSKEIKEHRWTNQHSDYEGASFSLLPGDVLADGGSFRIDAAKLYDPLNPPVGSFFKFLRSESQHKRIKVGFSDSETVNVQIPAVTFDSFQQFSHRPDLQISLVVLPALMETLNFIKKSRDEESLEEFSWFIEIEKLVESKGGWKQDHLELAQKILDSPIDTAIRTGLVSEDDDS